VTKLTSELHKYSNQHSFKIQQVIKLFFGGLDPNITIEERTYPVEQFCLEQKSAPHDRKNRRKERVKNFSVADTFLDCD
jgi:hypothetical protein